MSSASSMDNSCRPPVGSTYLTIGQDLFSINEYVVEQYNASLHNGSFVPMSAFAPAAVMTYTDIQTLRGLNVPVDYGTGVEYADGVLNSLFPNQGVGLQIGLWLGGKEGCDGINDGSLATELNTLIEYVENCRASKVFLRVGYEFDNPGFLYTSPSAYAKAFRNVVSAFRNTTSTMIHDKVKFVWHSWGAPIANGATLDEYYPGDEYVDWVGVSIFQQFYPWSSQEGAGNVDDVKAVLDFAVARGKPTMIAESTPFGGIDLEMIGNEKTNAYSSWLNTTNPWDRWYGQVLSLIDRYDVSMWSYINCNWEVQPMWHNIGFGETRISSNDLVMRRWRDKVLGFDGADAGGDDNSSTRRKFLLAGSLVNCGKEEIFDDPTKEVVLGLRDDDDDDNSTEGFVLNIVLGFTVVLGCTVVMLIKKHRDAKRRDDGGDSERTPLHANK